MIPLLVLWTGLGQRQANATSLVAIIPIGIAAVPIYYFNRGVPQVDLRVALFLIVGSMVASFRGFKEKAFFEAAPGSEQPPKVKF